MTFTIIFFEALELFCLILAIVGPRLASDFFEKFDLSKSEFNEYESLPDEPQMGELTLMRFLPKQLNGVPVLISSASSSM